MNASLRPQKSEQCAEQLLQRINLRTRRVTELNGAQRTLNAEYWARDRSDKHKTFLFSISIFSTTRRLFRRNVLHLVLPATFGSIAPKNELLAHRVRRDRRRLQQRWGVLSREYNDDFFATTDLLGLALAKLC